MHFFPNNLCDVKFVSSFFGPPGRGFGLPVKCKGHERNFHKVMGQTDLPALKSPYARFTVYCCHVQLP